MNYNEIIAKFEKEFKLEFGNYISNLIEDVKNEKTTIDYSVYTSKTVDKPSQITRNFLELRKIKDHSVTNVSNSFSLNLSFYLEMITFNDRQEMEAKLFNTITQKNIELNK